MHVQQRVDRKMMWTPGCRRLERAARWGDSGIACTAPAGPASTPLSAGRHRAHTACHLARTLYLRWLPSGAGVARRRLVAMAVSPAIPSARGSTTNGYSSPVSTARLAAAWAAKTADEACSYAWQGPNGSRLSVHHCWPPHAPSGKKRKENEEKRGRHGGMCGTRARCQGQCNHKTCVS